jgi:DNA repair exonuclease SbcCD nuclease subunit
MEALSNCEVIDVPTRAAIQGYEVDLIPWGMPIPGRFKGDILAGHIPVIGSWISGDKTKRADDGVSKETLFGYKYVFLGHFHERQQLDVPGAIYAGYIGSVIQINLGSSPAKRGVTLLTNTGDIVDHIIPSPTISEIKIPTQAAADYFLKETYNDVDYFKLVLSDYNITLPPFDHRVLCEYDVASTQEARLTETPDEDISETIDKFISQANTKLDKKEIKDYLIKLEKRI